MGAEARAAHSVWLYPRVPNPLCVCGHLRDAHEHYRRGTDCATCGPELCAKYRRASLRRRTPPTPPSSAPPAEPVERDDAYRAPLTATGPLAIVTELRSRARRGLSAT